MTVTRHSSARRGAVRGPLASAGLVAVLALVGCGTTGGAAGDSTSAPTEPASATGSAAGTASAEDPSGEKGSSAASAGTSTPVAAQGLPLVQLAPAQEDAGAVVAGGEAGPYAFPDATTVATATAAFDATDAQCGGGLSTGHPVTCTITTSGEGALDYEVFTAYAVRKGGNNGDGILFVQGEEGLPSDLADLTQDPNSMVYGIQKGTEYIQHDHSAQELGEDVVSLTRDPQAILAWAEEGTDSLHVQSATCSSGLTANSLDPGRCTMQVGGGLEVSVTALPARWAGDSAESGLLVIANGSD